MNELAFWHPFGPHGGETPEEILDRKHREICKNEWTLWSFRHMDVKTVESWILAIKKEKPKRVLVLCSASKNANDPADASKKRKTHFPSATI